jgi:hypothetical protein
VALLTYCLLLFQWPKKAQPPISSFTSSPRINPKETGTPHLKKAQEGSKPKNLVGCYFLMCFCNFRIHEQKCLPMLQVWVIGKWATPNDQKWAPPATHFHQFVVPNIIESRQDCTYGKLAAMRLPREIKGLRSCEVLVLKYLLIYNLLMKE